MELDSDGDSKLCSEFSSSSSSSSTRRISQDASTDSLHSPLPQQIHHLSPENQQQQRFNNWSLISVTEVLFSAKSMPVICSASAFLFTLWNGVLQSHFIVSLTNISSLNIIISITGIIIFITGMIINIQSDTILQSLRSGDDTGYKIPRAGLFRYVSCPHYLGEILEWCGFSLFCQTSARWGILFSDWLISTNTLLWLVDNFVICQCLVCCVHSDIPGTQSCGHASLVQKQVWTPVSRREKSIHTLDTMISFILMKQ